MGSSSPSTQNVVQSTQIPQYQQDYAIENENVARDIAARPFQQYQGQRIADLTPLQNYGIGQAQTAGLDPAYNLNDRSASNAVAQLLQSQYGQAIGATLGNVVGPAAPLTGGATGGGFINGNGYAAANTAAGGATAGGFVNNNGYATATQATGGARGGGFINGNNYAGWNPFAGSANPGGIAPWMSPYIDQALRPQLDAISRQSANTAKGINAGATAAGAFGDARHGVQLGENDRNTAKLMSDVTGAGYQSAFDRAVQASQTALGLNANINDQNNRGGISAYTTNAGQYNTEDAAIRAAIAENAGITGQNNRDFLSAYSTNAGQFNTEDAALRAAIAENASITGQNNRDFLSAYTTNAGQYNTEDAAIRAAIAENAGILGQNNAAYLATGTANAGILSQNNRDLLSAFQGNAGQFNADRAAQLSAASAIPGINAAGYDVSSQQAKDLLSVGKVQQDQTQQGLSQAYQDFINQYQYPQEQLNLRLATQQGSPYNTTRLTQTPYSPTAQNIGALASLFGFLGKPAGSTVA